MADYEPDDVDKRPDASGGDGSPEPAVEPHGGDQAAGEEREPSPERRGRHKLEGHLHALRRRLHKAETEAREARAIAEQYVRRAETSDTERRLGAVEAQLDARFNAAKAKLGKLDDGFDPEQFAAAQQELADVAVERSRLRVYRDSLKESGDQPADARTQRQTPAAAPDPQVEFFDQNDWWCVLPPRNGEPDLRTPFQRKMTAEALRVDAELRANGVDPTSRQFFDEVTRRVRQSFPQYFDDDGEDDAAPAAQQTPQPAAPPAAKPSGAPPLASSRTAPASRTPGKVRLSAAQLASARRMHLTPEEFARYLPAS